MSVDCGDDGEPYTVYNEHVRRARKDHKCSACGETIRRGDLYSYTFTVFDGDTDTVKRCARCESMYQALLKLHRNSDDGVAPRLDCGHTFQEIFKEDPAPEIARLAFMTPAEMQAEFAVAMRKAP